MRLTLKQVIVGAFILFILIIILRATGWLVPIIAYVKKYNRQLLLLAVILIVAYVIYYLTIKKKGETDTLMEKSWNFINEWWSDKIGVVDEQFKPEDTIMEEAFFDSTHGTFERMFGFNTVKKHNNQRIVFIVGTSPVRMVKVVNTPRIGEQDSPFKWFHETRIKPIPFAEDTQTTVPRGYDQSPYSAGENRRKPRDWIGDGRRRREEMIDEEPV